MAKAKKAKPTKKPEIKDEPGAEARFKDLVKRALVTPPKIRSASKSNKAK